MNNQDIEKAKKRQYELSCYVKELKGSLTLSELYELDKTIPGVLIQYWRERSSHHSFVEWLNFMESKDDKKIKEEVNLEDIDEQIRKIQEMYS